MAGTASRRWELDEAEGTARLVERVEEGFAFEELEHLREGRGMTAAEISDLVRIKPRTLSRRRAEGRLLPDESDRLLRLARVLDRVLSPFEGDTDAVDGSAASVQRLDRLHR